MTLVNLVKEADSAILNLNDLLTCAAVLVDLLERGLVGLSQLVVAGVDHVGMVDVTRVEHFYLIHLSVVSDDFVCLLLIRQKQLYLVLLLLLEGRQFMLLGHHKYLLEYLLVLLLPLARE